MNFKFHVQPDKPNSNGVIFKKEAIEKAIKEYNEKYVKKGIAYGHLRYPSNLIENAPNTDNAAYRIENINIKDASDIDVKIKILDTDSGNELKKELTEVKHSIIGVWQGDPHMNEDGHYIVDHSSLLYTALEKKEMCSSYDEKNEGKNNE